MNEHVELNDQELEMVIGGAFHYNTRPDGSMYCRVDDDKTYNCTDNAKQKISTFFVKNPDATLQDAINYALQNGYFWNI